MKNRIGAVFSLFFIYVLCIHSCKVTAAINITFLVGSDVHYLTDSANAQNNNIRSVINRMNAMPGTTLPGGLGGAVIDTPGFVVLCGDLVDGYADSTTAATQWKWFTSDWGLKGEKRLKFPVYEGYGNHDAQPPGATAYVLNQVRFRNNTRTIAAKSANGLHYSWDAGGIHFVHANLYGGMEGTGCSPTTSRCQPYYALDFVKNDLKTRVGATGKPVVYFQHYGWGTDLGDWWSVAESESLYAVLKNYNVIAAFWGHTHAIAITKWKSAMDVYNTGSLGPAGGFFVVKIVDSTMITAYNTPSGWNSYMQKKTIRLSATSVLTDKNSGKQFTCPVTLSTAVLPRCLSISFSLSRAATEQVSVELLDVKGRCIAEKFLGTGSQATHTVVFDRTGLCCGVYFPRVRLGSRQYIGKTVLF